MILEKQIEAKLRKYALSRGLLFWKLVSPGNRGVPDRLLIGPNGRTGFLEIKRPGGQTSALQKHTLNLLDARSHYAGVVYSYYSGVIFIDNFIAYCNLKA